MLYKLSTYFEMITPIMVFLLVLAAFAFLIYLKNKSDAFFENVRSIARDIKRIADNTEARR